jgi:two-component system, OmpR family, response regulator
MAEHVLVVDDDPVFRGLLREVLTEEGFAVKTAATGEEALAQVASDPPGVLVLDIELPRLDGWAVLRRVQEGPHPVPVVLMSVGPHRRHAAAHAHAVDYLAKPFDLDDLVHNVARFTTRQGRG